MIGRRTQQRNLFDVGNVFDVELDKRTFYYQLAVAGPRVFRDDDFDELYKKRGRQSVPPSQLALMTVLQCYSGCSDEEAMQRSAFDLRWCVVLGKQAGTPLCAKSTFQMFRAQLVIHDKVRTVLVASIKEAKLLGRLQENAGVDLLLDTKPIAGRGAVQDTYNLLGTGIKTLVGALAATQGQQSQEWAQAHDLGRYFGSSLKGSTDIDWSNKEAQDAFLTEVVADARRVLRLAGAVLSAGGLQQEAAAKIREAAQLLEQLLLQDVEEKTDDQGQPHAHRKEGTAPGRVPSATDPEQRHGHKSKNKRFTGHKAAVGVDRPSGIVTSTDVLPGNAPDAQDALKQVEESEQNTGEKVQSTTGDSAYGNTQTRQEFKDAGRDLAAKVPAEGTNGGRYLKSAFTLNLEENTVTCPEGHTARTFRLEKDGGKVFSFGCACQGCPQREKCTAAKEGRTIRVHPDEATRAAARAYQETPEGRARLRGRVGAEHALARLSHLRIGQARYVGLAKTRFQLAVAAAVANLRLVWNWAQGQGDGGNLALATPNGAAKAAANAVGSALRAIWRRWLARIGAQTPPEGRPRAYLGISVAQQTLQARPKLRFRPAF